MPTPINRDTVVTDPHDNKFFVAVKNNLYYTLPQSQMCLFARRERLSNCGIENFLIDLCFHEPDYEIVNKLVIGFKGGVKVENSTIFNFKAGLH
jgi:putative protease